MTVSKWPRVVLTHVASVAGGVLRLLIGGRRSPATGAKSVRMRSRSAIHSQILAGLFVLAACTRSDPGMIEIAKSLVPEGSEVTEMAENTGLAVEVGDYYGSILIDDGGLGPALLQAIEDRAVAEGWQERYRCDVPAGVTLGYSREDLQLDISAYSNLDPVFARIRIQRLGDGNAWPSDC